MSELLWEVMGAQRAALRTDHLCELWERWDGGAHHCGKKRTLVGLRFDRPTATLVIRGPANEASRWRRINISNSPTNRERGRRRDRRSRLRRA